MLGKEAPLGPGSYEIACLSAGLACAAVEAVLKGSWITPIRCRARPDTTACRTSRWDFVSSPIFPLPSSERKRSWGWARWRSLTDVHHGNGTQHIYLQRDDVLTISLHQDGCFPPGYAGEDDRGVGAGEGYNINIPLLAGAGMTAGAMRWKLSLFRRWRVLSRS